MQDQWCAIDAEAGIYRAIYHVTGTSPFSTAVRLSEKQLLVYSPGPGLRMHKIFRLGLKDKPGFKQWALPLFDNDRQHILLPCHREVYDADDCGARMVKILRAAG